MSCLYLLLPLMPNRRNRLCIPRSSRPAYCAFPFSFPRLPAAAPGSRRPDAARLQELLPEDKEEEKGEDT
eukprot:7625510-Pyramimonas_sp.AAC.1